MDANQLIASTCLDIRRPTGTQEGLFSQKSRLPDAINQLRAIGAGLFYLLIFLSGYRLSRSGKPYNVIVLTVHKLLSVAAVVFLIAILIRSDRAAALGASELVAGLVTGLFFLSLIVTGALLSGGAQMPTLVSKLHQIAPYLTLISTVITLYLLQGRR